MSIIIPIKSIKIIFLILLCLSSLTMFAQDSEPESKKFSISGSVDAYFRGNFNGLNKSITDDAGTIVGVPQAPATSFVNDPGFALGMVNLIASYEGKKVGFVADLVFGPRGEDAVFLSDPSSNIINQLYVFWKVNNSLRLTLGNFNTFLGYEVISPVGNFNYSTSYLFSYGPFSHTGIKADFTFSKNWSALLAVMNPTDWTEFNPYAKYTLGGQIGYTNPLGSAYLNLIYGEQSPDSEEATLQIDLTTGWNLTKSFYLGFNSTYNSTDGTGFYGAALYPQINTSEKFAIGLRAEYFKELSHGNPNAIVYGSSTNVFAFTLTGNYKIENLTIKPELRIDKVSENVFTDFDLQPTDNLSSFVLAAVYAF